LRDELSATYVSFFDFAITMMDRRFAQRPNIARGIRKYATMSISLMHILLQCIGSFGRVGQSVTNALECDNQQHKLKNFVDKMFMKLCVQHNLLKFKIRSDKEQTFVVVLIRSENFASMVKAMFSKYLKKFQLQEIKHLAFL